VSRVIVVGASCTEVAVDGQPVSLVCTGEPVDIADPRVVESSILTGLVDGRRDLHLAS